MTSALLDTVALHSLIVNIIFVGRTSREKPKGERRRRRRQVEIKRITEI